MTAYTVAPQFNHGDFPLSADLNKISTGQIHIYEVAKTYLVNSFAPEMDTGERATFTHGRRWLHYKSTGTIIDSAGIGDDVALPNPSDNWANVYDLDSVSWLAYGALYYVDGVDFAQERDTG